MTGAGNPVTALNAAERDLLLLLGQGHTAKSIATLKGLSEHAVNERFRSARRKTGIGSSREIARLLAAQENRDDFIDLVEPAASAASVEGPDAHRRASSSRWRLPMAAAVLLAAAILAQQTSVPPERPLPPAAAAIFARPEPAPDLAALHAEIASGPADPAWSTDTEAALSRIYHHATDPTGALATLDITCSATLCEVLGVSREGLTGPDVVALTEAVQSRATNQAVRALNLDSVVQSFHSNGQGETGTEVAATVIFAAYWRRAD